MGNIGEQITTIAVAIVGVAILAVLVSKNSNTANVVNAAGAAFSGALATAVSPVTGTATQGFTGGAAVAPFIYNPNLSFPNLAGQTPQAFSF